MGIFSGLTDVIDRMSERRNERKIWKMQEKSNRVESRTNRQINRQNARSYSRQTAYNNGIDPMASAWQGGADMLGSVGDMAGAYFSGGATMLPDLLSNGEEQNIPGDNSDPNKKKPFPTLLVVGAVLAYFLLIKKK